MPDHLCEVHGETLPCKRCRNCNPYTGPLSSILIVFDSGVQHDIRCRDGRVSRCVSRIADSNIPDAIWAAEVLNRFGHLVKE